jgi:hypothetical protein
MLRTSACDQGEFVDQRLGQHDHDAEDGKCLLLNRLRAVVEHG